MVTVLRSGWKMQWSVRMIIWFEKRDLGFWFFVDSVLDLNYSRLCEKCFHLLLCYYVKNHCPKSTGRKGFVCFCFCFYTIYHPVKLRQELKLETWSRNWSREHEGCSSTGLPNPLLRSLSHSSGSPAQRVLSTVLAPPTPTSNPENMPHRHVCRPGWWRNCWQPGWLIKEE